jgi:hypothetical protein
MLYFIFSHLNAIVLAVWVLFLVVVAVRFFCPAWIRNISFWKLIFIALGLNIFYGLFVTWGQYYVWANGNDLTKALLNSPLSKNVPFMFEWLRPLFENHLGYFLYYVLGRVWLNIFILFFISGLLYFLFKIWKSHRGNFTEQGPEILLVLMLTSGYPGILVSVPLGFVLAILFSIFSIFRSNKIINIEPFFIISTLFALFFTNIILSVL